MTTSRDRAEVYDRLYPGSIDDFGQKVERVERIETRERRRAGGRGLRYFTVPELPWRKEAPNGR